ncbi:MAG TPA: TIGR03960 family B12-binding radical SAM protein [Candidatus Wallbacteria bacterium]|nr:TIGR03960 family B12-binding radical SAM protein [Candidatus Wallbacteria bacterium]
MQNVEKPQQYIGKEYGLKTKSAENAADRKNNARFLLSFPDTYDIGMSNHAMKIIYEMLDTAPGVIVDRAYIPGDDYARLSKELSCPLTSLNYRLPALEFDVIGFTLEYELNFSNVLYFLDLACIPLLSADRREGHPIIISGGSACVNPEPMADFIDVFFIGDGEPMVPEIVAAVKNSREKGLSRAETIAELSRIEGAYVPAFYEPVFDGFSQTGVNIKKAGAPVKATMREAKDLDACFHPTHFPVPNFETIFNRGMVEIARGCKHACRFCQAGFIYRPYRERSLGVIKNIIREVFLNTGYSEFTLSSLSATDHANLREIIDYVAGLNKSGEEFSETLFSVSLPSQRISTFSVELARALSTNRKSGLTFAPEAGSQLMRDRINKNVTGEDLFATAGAAIDAGYRLIKLYFMIGLPYETDDDLREMASLVSKVMDIAREKRAKTFAINVTFSTFIPKPHTPFQWAAQTGEDEIKRRQSLLKEELKRFRSVTMKFTNYRVSALESAFARGSRLLGKVLLAAHKLGCRFDAWDDKLKSGLWERAFSESGIDMKNYISRPFSTDEILPWQIVDTGVATAYLKTEYLKAASAELTEKCDPARCKRCGVC